MEPSHDNEIVNPALDNRLRQPGHARLALRSLEPEGKDDEAKEGNNVYEEMSGFWIYARRSTIDTNERDL